MSGIIGAEPLGERTWAIESAGGLGYLLSQQLVAAGETVLDVPSTLAARIGVLGSRRSDTNDPNDALSVAVAALRTPELQSVPTCPDAGPTWSSTSPIPPPSTPP